jgi:hypothetical protein
VYVDAYNDRSRRPMQHQSLEEMVEISKKAPIEFSLLQINNLVNRNTMTNRYNDFTRNAGLVENPLAEKAKGRLVHERIRADRDRSYILLKKDDDAPGYKMTLNQNVLFGG